jgi:YD repeat-containing protein
VGQYLIPDGMHSWADIDNWVYSYEMPHYYVACSFGALTSTEISGWPEHTLGIESGDAWDDSISAVVAKNYNPPCSLNENLGGQVTVTRWVSCPPGTSANGDNYCVSTGAATPLKQQGRCPCQGKTVEPKDPVDVSDGNNYLSETDYQAGSGGALKFVRSYNSVSHNTNAAMTLMGSGWSATYFQYLEPMTVTENGTSSTTVYAYRPDGRVLSFNLYNGVYSPDGDVDSSLIQTADGGWQYQTADDTIETYNAGGQLLSIARRGQAPVTVNYAPGAVPGDPPISVSDAFGHTLQFTYFVPYSAQRLKSITDPSGNTIQFTYDTYGDDLTSVTYQDGTKRTYAFDNSNGLPSETDESGVAYRSWTYTPYDTEVASSQRAGGVDKYTYSYSLSGPTGSATVVDPLGESRTYDQQLIWGSYYMTSSSGLCRGCDEAKSLSFDADANITSRTDFNGNVTQYTYDPTTNLETSRTEAYGTLIAWLNLAGKR